MVKNVFRLSKPLMKLLTPTGALHESKILPDQYPYLAKLPKLIDLFKHPIQWKNLKGKDDYGRDLQDRYPNFFEFSSDNYILQLEIRDILDFDDDGGPNPQSSLVLWGKSTGDAGIRLKKIGEFDSLPDNWKLPRQKFMPAV